MAQIKVHPFISDRDRLPYVALSVESETGNGQTQLTPADARGCALFLLRMADEAEFKHFLGTYTKEDFSPEQIAVLLKALDAYRNPLSNKPPVSRAEN